MDANRLAEAPQYDYDKEKDVGMEADVAFGDHPGVHRSEDVVKANPLSRALQGRHMQMIAIGITRRSAEMELVFLT